MTLLFPEPFAPLFGLSREVGRRGAPGAALRSFVPAADVIATEDAVTVFMDVPGLTVDDVTIELQDDHLTVTGERAMPADGEDAVWQQVERGFGAFRRVLRVPHGLDPERISAAIADGVLTLRIPQPEAPKPRRIEIATGGDAEAMEAGPGARELAGSAA